MKAAVLERIGASPKFIMKELPRPSINVGQVLVRNYASSVNPVDTIVRQGKSLFATIGLNKQVIGSDFCGKIIASKSRRFKEGDEVFGMISALRGEAYAEEIAVDEDSTALKPSNLTYIEAGVIPLVGLTAYQGLLKVGRLQEGEHVLIAGCTGGVGSAAVQLAKSLNAHVSGLCSKEHMAYAKTIGCDVVIDYELANIQPGTRFDLIFDAAGKYTLSSFQHHLTEQAYFVTTKGETNNLKGIVKTATDLVLEKRMKFVVVKPDPEDLLNIKNKIEQHQVKLHIAATFALEELTKAHQMMEAGGFVGKIAVEIG